MYTIKGRTTTMVNDEMVTRTYFASQRKDRSESAQVTATMEAKAKAERKARGRYEQEQEV